MADARTKATIRRAAKKGRKRIHQLDAAAKSQLRALYRQARGDVEREIRSSEDLDGTIRLEHLQGLKQRIERRLFELDQSRDQAMMDALREAADNGVAPFVSVSGSVQEIAHEAVQQTVRFVAADGLQLSDRIWRLNQSERAVIANQVEQAIIQGDSAARAAREFITEGVEIPPNIRRKIGKAQAEKIARATGAELMNGDAYKNALRLFRTEINRAHGEAFMAAAFDSDDVVATRFLLSPNHPRTDICDMHARVNRYGLGPGVYPKGKNPWPAHPNTLSFVEVVFDDEVSDEDRAGKEDPITWLKAQPAGIQHGVLGHPQKVAALDRGLLRQGQVGTPWKTLKKRYEKAGHNPADWVPVTAKPLPEIDPPTPAPTAGGFLPAKTPNQAARWAMEQDLADFADYSGSRVEVANAWNESVHQHVRRFPELRKNLRFIGSTQARNVYWREQVIQENIDRIKNSGVANDLSDEQLRHLVERRVPRRRIKEKYYAVSTPEARTRGVSVHNYWGGNPTSFKEHLASDVKAGWHPVGTDTIKSVIDHELGHQLDDLLSINRMPEIQNLFRNWAHNNSNGADLSRYALKNIKEFIAESWAEYLNNPDPRPISRQVGDLIVKTYGDQFDG